MQVIGTTILPVLIRVSRGSADGADVDGLVLDVYADGLAVGYTFGPPFGTRLVGWDDLEDLRLPPNVLRHRAYASLEAMLGSARLHGTGPMYQISFHGVESSLLLAETFWSGLAVDTPGEIVIGAPARDVLCVTGSGSAAGIAKAWRCVDRVFFAGGPHLLMRDLMVWRDGWSSLDTADATVMLPAIPMSPAAVGSPPAVDRPEVAVDPPGAAVDRPRHAEGRALPRGVPAQRRSRARRPVHYA